MKTTKLLLIALVLSAMAASSAIAQSDSRISRTNTRPSVTTDQRTVANHWRGDRYRHRHYRHRSRSNVFFGIGLGYPYYGYGYPYYGSYPYGYGYYSRPRAVVYAETAYTDDATVAAVQRRLARGGYYRGAIDGVIGQGTRTAIRAYERNNGLRVDGRIDRQLLATMGLA
jgi:Putative peptidoglycan binding domain